MRSLHSISHNLFLILAVLFNKKPAGCSPITSSGFNDHIRDFSLKDDSINSTRIKTLQKEGPRRYANFTSIGPIVQFKEASDNALSSSSYSRGLLQHEHSGYESHHYDEGPPGFGYEYHGPHLDHAHPGFEHHAFDHHPPDHYYGHHDAHHHVNYHHKHYDHALAAKSVLWPIAGIALLGAAAALVSNPILLQLGVVSGRRKRRDTEDAIEEKFNTKPNWLQSEAIKEIEVQPTEPLIRNKHINPPNKRNLHFKSPDCKGYRNRIHKRRHSNIKQETSIRPTIQSLVDDQDLDTSRQDSSEMNERNLVPVPLLIKGND